MHPYKKILVMTVLGCFLSTQYGYAQTNSSFVEDTLTGNEFWENAQNSFIEEKYDSALVNYGKAVIIYRKLLNHTDKLKWSERFILCHIIPAYIHYNKGEYEPALVLSKLALDAALLRFQSDDKMLGDVYMSFGYAYHVKADYDSALIFYIKGKEVFLNALGENHNKVAYAYNSLGTITLAKGDLKLAEKYFMAALGVWENNFQETDSRIGTALNNLGIVYLQLGAYEKAKEFFERSIEVKKNGRGTDYRSLAFSYFNIANNYSSSSDWEIAFSYYLKAQEFHVKRYKGGSTLLSKIYDGIGASYLQSNETDSALLYFHRSLDYRSKTLKEQHPLIARSYAHLGQAYMKRKRYAKAMDFYERALIIDIKTYGEHQNIADYYHNIGMALIKLQKNNAANEAFDKAIDANIIGESSRNIYESGVLAHDYYSPKVLVNTLHSKATLLSQSLDINKKKLGLRTFLVCDSVIFRLQARYLKQQDLVVFSKNISEFYNDAIKYIYNASDLLQFTEIGNHSLDELAFHFIERSKSASLFINSKEVEAMYSAGVPNVIRKRENSLKTQRSTIVQKLGEEPEKKSKHKALLFKVNRQYDSLIAYCQRTYPKYYKLTHSTDFISLDRIRRFLPNNSSVIEYFLSDSSIYCMVISDGKVTTKTISLSDNIFGLIERMNKGIEARNNAMYVKSSHKLFLKIIDPIYKEIEGEKLFIIPDGQLWNVNFDLLLTDLPGSKTYEEFDYLIKYHDIGYGHSANLLFRDRSNKLNDKNGLLAFSYGDVDVTGQQLSMSRLRDLSITDLPGSRREIKLISEIFNGDYFYGNHASEENFKAYANNYSILHLALHGQVDSNHPDDSKLYFTQENGGLEDGYLYIHELYNMQLNAELAVLSACETGAGKVEPGEGIMSLGRAFSYAGVKSLLLTRRKISDDITASIMNSFYKEIKNGKSKSGALRSAKLHYLKNAPTPAAHPLFWGSFYILGNDRPFVSSSNNEVYLIGTVVTILIIVCLFFIKNYRNSSRILTA